MAATFEAKLTKCQSLCNVFACAVDSILPGIYRYMKHNVMVCKLVPIRSNSLGCQKWYQNNLPHLYFKFHALLHMFDDFQGPKSLFLN